MDIEKNLENVKMTTRMYLADVVAQEKPLLKEIDALQARIKELNNKIDKLHKNDDLLKSDHDIFNGFYWTRRRLYNIWSHYKKNTRTNVIVYSFVFDPENDNICSFIPKNSIVIEERADLKKYKYTVRHDFFKEYCSSSYFVGVYINKYCNYGNTEKAFKDVVPPAEKNFTTLEAAQEYAIEIFKFVNSFFRATDRYKKITDILGMQADQLCYIKKLYDVDYTKL